MTCFKLLSAVNVQLIENLRGKSDHTVRLCESWIENEDSFTKSGSKSVAGWCLRFKCMACMYFAEYEMGAKLVLDLGGLDNLRNNFLGLCFGSNLLPFGLCCYAIARRNGHAKCKRAANQLRAETQKDVDGGCVNLIHVLSLLNAEFYALNGQIAQAKESYAKAAVDAIRGGFLQNGAVANERYGDFLLDQQDRTEAAHRYRKAVECYKEWGATGVVKRLSRRHQDLLASFD
eukprot:scaffold310_cov168-Amphora_coffeaeformis.AAC.14